MSNLNTAEKIRIAVTRSGQTMYSVAEALGCELKISFIDKTTGEEI